MLGGWVTVMPPAAAVPGMLTVVEVRLALREADGLLELDAWLEPAAADWVAVAEDMAAVATAGGNEGVGWKRVSISLVR